MMKRIFLSGLATSLGLGAAVAVAEGPSKDSVKGSAITISGCVITDKDNSGVLTQVQKVSGSADSTPTLGANGLQGEQAKVLYWLSSDSAKLLRGHIGHRVEVSGVITDVSTGTVRTRQEPGKPGPDNDTKITIEARGKETTGKTEQPVGPGVMPGTKSDEKEVLPVHRIKVDTVKMIAATCS